MTYEVDLLIVPVQTNFIPSKREVVRLINFLQQQNIILDQVDYQTMLDEPEKLKTFQLDNTNCWDHYMIHPYPNPFYRDLMLNIYQLTPEMLVNKYPVITTFNLFYQPNEPFAFSLSKGGHHDACIQKYWPEIGNAPDGEYLIFQGHFCISIEFSQSIPPQLFDNDCQALKNIPGIQTIQKGILDILQQQSEIRYADQPLSHYYW